MRYFFSVLALLTALVWIAVFTIPDDNLHIVACDVGQGDAYLIQKGSTQILVDGGPNNQVIDCLGSHMSFWDRRLELVVATHADADHITGLVEVFERFDVDSFLVSELGASTQVYKALEKAVGGQEVKIIKPAAGKEIRLGTIHLDILWPVGSTLKVMPAKSQNDTSVVFILKYKDFDAFFTGDIGSKISDEIAEMLTMNPTLASGSRKYLKVPHHGSKNGLTESLLTATQPQVAVISAGSGNRFGHPHEEILDLLDDEGVRVLRTDLRGETEIATDGQKFWLVVSD